MPKKGESWERRLMHQHEAYRRDRRALILRCHPEVRITHRAGAAVTGRLAGEGPPDFLGLIYETGAHPAVPVVAEAKSTVAAAMPWAMIPRHQGTALEACALGGGMALILAEIAGEGWVLDWPIIAARWRAGGAPYRPGEHGGRHIVGADWLGAL